MLHYNTQDPIFDTLLDLYTLPRHSNHKSRKPSFAIPNTDVLESKDAYKVVVQLPGMAKESISINFEENTLTITTKEETPIPNKVDGEVSEELESQSKHKYVDETEVRAKSEEFKAHIKQITSKPYKKVIEFPTQVNYENITADYTNGLLTLILPKSAKFHKSISIV